MSARLSTLLCAVTVAVAARAQHEQFRDASPRAMPAGLFFVPYTAIDLDGNGLPDAISSQSVLFHDGPGLLRSAVLPTSRPGGSGAPIAGDFDADGDVDLVVSAGAFPTFVIELLRNDGSGNLRLDPAGVAAAHAWPANDGFAADLDADGFLDVVLSTSSRGIDVLRNDRAGNLRSVGVLLAGVFISGIEPLDADGDGDVDIVAVSSSPTQAPTLLINIGGATFVPSAIPWPASPAHRYLVAQVDADEDGRDDLLFGPIPQLVLRTASGWVDATATLPALGGTIGRIGFADVDLDGLRDLLLVVLDRTGWRPRLLRNGPAGTFTDETLRRVAPFVESWTDLPNVIVDWDADGDPDWLVAEGISGSSLSKLKLVPNHHLQSTPVSAPVVGGTYTIEIDARPGYARTPKSALPILGGRAAQLPIPGVGLLRIDPGSMIVLPPVWIPLGGRTAVGIPVPNDPTLAGNPVATQVLIADPEAGGGGFALTGAWFEGVGR